MDARRFDLNAFPHLPTIYNDRSKVIIIEKAAQMGLTVWATEESFHKTWTGLNWLYAFPTDKLLRKFVQGRYDKLINMNPKLEALIENTDNTALKQIGDGIIYFAGLGSTTKEGGSFDTISVPVDGVTFDERNKMKDDKVKEALSRMLASPYKFQRRLSTPKLPGNGIDLDYHGTDMKVWGMKCPHCNYWNFLDDEKHYKMKDYAQWCMERIEQGFLACQKCGKALDQFRGEFVPQKPKEEGISGYHVSGLYSPFLDCKGTVKEFNGLASAKEIQIFWNDTLGFPFVDVKSKLSKEALLTHCTGRAMALEGLDAYIGIDIGGARKGLHVVIAKPDNNWVFDVLWLGVIHEPDTNDPKFIDWIVDEIAKKCLKFRIKKGCIDCEPQHLSRAITNRIKKLWRCQYNVRMSGPYKWDDATHIVQVNRTESLDASHDILAQGKIRLPMRNDEVEEFAQHCANIAKDEERDDDTGQVEYTWKKVGQYDDYRHAFNYMIVASGYDAKPRLTQKASTVILSADPVYRPRMTRAGKMDLGW